MARDLTELELRGPYTRHLVDRDVNGNLLYEGWARPGTQTSDSAWFIVFRLFDASNYYKECKSARDVVWDNRASVTYS